LPVRDGTKMRMEGKCSEKIFTTDAVEEILSIPDINEHL
jgi:hypothetical protein